MSGTDRAQQLIEALRTTGHRITPQRVAVCRVLAQSKDHPTALAIHSEVSDRFPGISQATVYNTLTVLRDLGEIVEVGLGQDRTHYEPDPTPHVNLICLGCGAIRDLEDETVRSLSASLSERHGLEMKAARLDIYGFCTTCAPPEKTNELGQSR
jgi:Fur family transcriptional regulator, peroxide stress response regulator